MSTSFLNVLHPTARDKKKALSPLFMALCTGFIHKKEKTVVNRDSGNERTFHCLVLRKLFSS
jgi:hypothetical protein